MDLEAYVSGNVPHLWCSHLGRWGAYRFRLWADRGWIFPALMCLSSLCKMISPDPMARLHRSLTAFLCRSLSPVLNQKDHISPNLRTLYFMLASFWCCVLAYLGQINSFFICMQFSMSKSSFTKKRKFHKCVNKFTSCGCLREWTYLQITCWKLGNHGRSYCLNNINRISSESK